MLLLLLLLLLFLLFLKVNSLKLPSQYLIVMLLVSSAVKEQTCEYICRNKAIADYLSANGYTNTLAEFQKETNLVCYLYFFVVISLLCGVLHNAANLY